jgi:hypothetical protein
LAALLAPSPEGEVAGAVCALLATGAEPAEIAQGWGRNRRELAEGVILAADTLGPRTALQIAAHALVWENVTLDALGQGRPLSMLTEAILPACALVGISPQSFVSAYAKGTPFLSTWFREALTALKLDLGDPACLDRWRYGDWKLDAGPWRGGMGRTRPLHLPDGLVRPEGALWLLGDLDAYFHDGRVIEGDIRADEAIVLGGSEDLVRVAGHLEASRKIHLAECPRLERIEASLWVPKGRLLLHDCTALMALDSDIRVKGALCASRCEKLVRIGDTVSAGTLHLDGCERLESLPTHVDVNELDLRDCHSLRALPLDLTIRQGFRCPEAMPVERWPERVTIPRTSETETSLDAANPIHRRLMAMAGWGA